MTAPPPSLIAPGASELIILPGRDGFTYDYLLFPTSNPILDNTGLLFTIDGLSEPVNLYSNGTSSYLQSIYIGGENFPNNFINTPVALRPIGTPEPFVLAMFLMGFLVLLATSKNLIN